MEPHCFAKHDLHYILKISVMTVDTMSHQFFWSPLKISKAIYKLSLHDGLPIRKSFGTESSGTSGQRLPAHSLKFLRAHCVLASVLSGTTPLPAFSHSGDDTGFKKHCSLCCSSAEELVLSFNGPLDHGSW